MIPEDLLSKQEEMQARSLKARASQHRKNASGPRKEKKTTRARWSPIKICKEIAADASIHAKYRIDALALIPQFQGKGSFTVPSQKQVKDKDDEYESPQSAPQSGFTLRPADHTPTVSESGQEREAVSME
jgi:hypothetical protein